MSSFATPGKKMRLSPTESPRDRHASKTVAERAATDAAVEPHAGTAALHRTAAQLARSPHVQRLAQLRAVVNRQRPVDSSRMPVQAYFAVGGGHLTAAAGTTFPSQEIREGVPTRSVKTAAGGGGGTTSVRSSYTPATRNWMPQAPVALANLPPMRVSEHAELAIENTAGQAQATSFFATPAAVQASNQALTAVASPVRLRRSAETITVPTNPNPNPALFDATPKTLSGVAAATHVPLTHPSAEAGALLSSLFGVSNCDDVVGKIVGPGKRAVVVGTGANRTEARYRDFEPSDQIGGYVGANAGAHTVAGLAGAARQPAAAAVDPAAQAGYQAEIAAHGEPPAALGLNRHAEPRIGEAFFTASLADAHRTTRMATAFPTGTGDHDDQYRAALLALQAVGAHADIMQSAVTAAQKTLRPTWNNHYAGVVARDGADAVTMENYARPKEREWNVLRTFNSLYEQFAEFRTFVRSQQAALRSQDTQQLSGLIATAQQESLNNARALHARRLELQAALTSITQNVEAVDSEMLHFRMYGAQPGQSFHEQFQGSTANAVTMTLGSSFDASRDSERQETLRVCNLTISALSLNAADPAINSGLAQKRADVGQLGQFRLNALAACTDVEDIIEVREHRYLRGMSASVVEFLRARAAAIAPAAGRFAAPTSTGTLQTDLAAAIADNDRGANPFGRDARKRNKRNLRDIKQVVDALHAVLIYE